MYMLYLVDNDILEHLPDPATPPPLSLLNLLSRDEMEVTLKKMEKREINIYLL